MKPDAMVLLKAAAEFLEFGNLHRLRIDTGQRVTKQELVLMIRNEIIDSGSLSDLRDAGGIADAP